MNSKDSSQPPIDTSSDGLNAQIKRFNNVDQNYITITENKMELILRDHLEKIETKKAWTTPLGIFLSLIAIPITTEKFIDAFHIPAQYWKAMLYIAIPFSLIWSAIKGFKAFKNRNISIKDIIAAMKKQI